MSSSCGKRKIVGSTHVVIRDGEQSYKIKIFQWSNVEDLKNRIFRELAVPASQQRLFHKNVELQSGKLLEDYAIFQHKQIALRVIILDRINGKPDFNIKPCPGILLSKDFGHLIKDVQKGLSNGLAPMLTFDGTGGTYLMRDQAQTISAVFKPTNEEAFAPFNPRGYVNKLSSPGFKEGVLSGEQSYREVIAYLLDTGSFSRVPQTALVEAQHTAFNYTPQHALNPNDLSYKVGSLQEYVQNDGVVEDFAPQMFPAIEVEKIAILDLKIANMDRNTGNILVRREEGKTQLIPIDHGLSIPDVFEIAEYDVCWMSWPQVKQEITWESECYIRNLDVPKYVAQLKQTINLRDICLRNLRIAGTVLQKGVCAGLTLYHIGTIIYRPAFGDDGESIIEQIITKAEQLHMEVQSSLTSQLKMRRWMTISEEFPAITSPAGKKLFEDEGPSSSTDQDSLTGEDGIRQTEKDILYWSVSDDETEEEQEIKGKKIRRSLSQTNMATQTRTLKTDKVIDDQRFFAYFEAFLEQVIRQKLKDMPRETGRARANTVALG